MHSSTKIKRKKQAFKTLLKLRSKLPTKYDVLPLYMKIQEKRQKIDQDAKKIFS